MGFNLKTGMEVILFLNETTFFTTRRIYERHFEA